MVIAHAHEDRAAINALIRKGLQAQGQLEVDEVQSVRLAQRMLTPAELHILTNYRPGDVLRFDADYAIAKKGTYFTVNHIDGKNQRLDCLSEEGLNFSINPAAIAEKSRLSVYRAEDALLAKGDAIRLRLTDNARGREANKKYTVTSVTKDRAILEHDEGNLTLLLNQKKDAHWDYAYTTTAFGAEGLTSDFVLALELGMRTKATTHRSHEISVTRPREQVTIYTEDEPALIARLERLEGDKTSAYLMNDAMNGPQKIRASKPPQAPSIKAGSTRLAPLANMRQDLTHEETHQRLIPLMKTLCEHLMGKPAFVNSDSLRYGAQGRLCINLKTGLWHHVETGETGNALALIARELGHSVVKDSLCYANNFLNLLEGDRISHLSRPGASPMRPQHGPGVMPKVSIDTAGVLAHCELSPAALSDAMDSSNKTPAPTSISQGIATISPRIIQPRIAYELER